MGRYAALPWLVSAVLVLLAPRVVWAQGMPHTKASCPEGSVVSGEVGGREVCALQNCNDDADCGPGRVCRDRPLCVETLNGAGLATAKTALGTCESGGKCTYPAECDETSRRCVQAGLVERYRTSCGCDVLGIGAGQGPVFASLTLALVLAHRRARRRRGV